MNAETFLLYNLRVAGCLIVFYLLFKILVSRETYHKLNRALLLLGTLSAFILPVCRITIYTETPETAFITIDGLTATLAEPDRQFPWAVLFLTVYSLGCAATVGMLIYSLLRVRAISHKGRQITLPDGVTLVLTADSTAPFSNMKTIVMSEADYAANGQEILIHEYAHIRGYHSADLLLFNMLSCLQWFNPAIWLLKNELCAVHEYEADATVLKQGINAKQYQLLLIEKAVGKRWFSVANSFNHSKLKNRITMMLRKESSKWAHAKALYILPVICAELLLFAQTSCTSETADKDSEKTQTEETVVAANTETAPAEVIENQEFVGAAFEMEEIYTVVEQMPEFPGGQDKLFQYLKENIKYPDDAEKAGLEGRVICQFVVDKDGSITDINVIKSINESLDKEAVRVIKAMPKWKPGKMKGEAVRVKFTIPISFRLK